MLERHNNPAVNLFHGPKDFGVQPFLFNGFWEAFMNMVCAGAGPLDSRWLYQFRKSKGPEGRTWRKGKLCLVSELLHRAIWFGPPVTYTDGDGLENCRCGRFDFYRAPIVLSTH